jgi:MFS family permease
VATIRYLGARAAALPQPGWRPGAGVARGLADLAGRHDVWLSGAFPRHKEDPGRFAPLKRRNYLLYLGGQAISVLGGWIQYIAQDLLVLQLTQGSGFWLGTVVALQTIPSALSIWGGVLADRHDKRRLLMITNGGLLVTAALLGLLTLTGDVALVWILLIAPATGALSAISKPIQKVFVTEVVGEEQLSQAASLTSLVFTFIQVAGPVTAPIVITALGLGWAFVLNAASFAVVLVALLLIDPASLERAPPKTRESVRLKDVITYLRHPHQRDLATVLWLWPVVASFALNLGLVVPLLAYNGLGVGLSGYGALATASGVGAVLGGVLNTLRRPGRPPLGMVLGGALALGVVSVVTGLMPTLAFAIPLMAITNVARLVYVNTSDVYVQMSVADKGMRGRVMGLYMTLAYIGDPIVAPLLGLASEIWTGRAPSVIGGGVAALAAGVAIVLSLRFGRGRAVGP